MRVLQFPIAKITFFFVIGILLGYSFLPNITFVFSLLFISFFINFVFYKFKKQLFFSASIFMFSIVLGLSTQGIQDIHNNKSNYFHFINSKNSAQHINITVVEKLKKNSYTSRYFATVKEIDGKSCSGKILLNVYTDSSKTAIEVGDNLLFSTKIIGHKPPNNPDQFDYGKYLSRKLVMAQVFVSKNDLKISSKKTRSLWFYANNFREKIINNLRSRHFREQELQVINALILGQQQEIDGDVMRDYQFAGAVHVLSVSGLHVGYILLFLNLLLSFLPKNRLFNILKFIIILFSLWTFAFIAGLSPSVVRSATMFSFLAAGQCLGRETNIFYTLLASLFFILLIEPSFIFDVGFQLSYVSLFFILWVQPIFRKWWSPKNVIISYFWDILAVSAAAQLGAFPLSIYYFHQFPGLFFITNLVILPTLGFIMAWGICVMAMAYFGYVPAFPALVLEKMIYCLNTIIGKIAHIESFVIKDISLNQYMLVCAYLIIIGLIFCFQKVNFSRIIFLLVSVIFFQITFFANSKQVEQNQSMLVFHQSKKTIIVKRNGKNATIFANDSVLKTIAKNKTLQSYLVANFLTIQKNIPLENVLFYKSKKILVVDSSFVMPQNINADLVLVTGSPRLNFERFIADNHPKVVVADGSNYKSYCKLWAATCAKRKIPFHATAEKGFYKIE